jgi:thioesterase-3
VHLCVVFKIDHTIRGFHCDAYGHVNNARYLEFYEECRWDFLQPAIEESFFESRDLIFVVVNINISYKKPLLPNTHVEIICESMKFNNMSMVIHQQIIDKSNDVLCSEADITFVLLNKTTGRPTEITNEIRAKFNELLEM